MNNVFGLINERKSVRTFDSDEITPSVRENILNYAHSIKTPYEQDIEVRILDKGVHGLSSPVIIGTDTFIAAKMKRAEHAEEAFGYFFEELVLYIQSLGLGTTWIGGTMDRKAFEDAMELDADEVMPCITPIGTPAEKRSLREIMMRKGIKADSRRNFEELFFDGSIDNPLSEGRYPELSEILEAVRLAPSAVNRQPWRVIVNERGAHFYLKHDRGYTDKTGWDMQKIDMGIALCHFGLCAEANEIETRFSIEDPGLDAGKAEYIASFLIEKWSEE